MSSTVATTVSASEKNAMLVGVLATEVKNTNIESYFEFTTVMPNGVLRTSVKGSDVNGKHAVEKVTWKYVSNNNGKEYAGVSYDIDIENDRDSFEHFYKGAVIIELSKECLIILMSKLGIPIMGGMILLHETEDSDLKLMQRCKSEIAAVHKAEMKAVIAERDSLRRELALFKRPLSLPEMLAEKIAADRPAKVSRTN